MRIISIRRLQNLRGEAFAVALQNILEGKIGLRTSEGLVMRVIEGQAHFYDKNGKEIRFVVKNDNKED